MAESTKHKEGDLNSFKDGTDSKTDEKEAMNVEAENDANCSNAPMVHAIDEDIAKIQPQATKAVSSSIEASVALDSNEIKENNPDIEAASNGTEERGNGGGTSRDISYCPTLGQGKIAASFAEEQAVKARSVIPMGQDLVKTIHSTVEAIKSHIGLFAQKNVEERGSTVADYTSWVLKYEAAVTNLQERIPVVETALESLEKCAEKCNEYADLVYRLTDITLDESQQTIASAKTWNIKTEDGIYDFLKTEQDALLKMGEIWRNMRDDNTNEESNRTPEVSDEEIQQCQNRERKAKIGHFVATLLGISLLAITALFKVGSNSFYAILVLGLLTTVWCIGYWSVKLFKYLKRKHNERTAQRPEDRYIEKLGKRLNVVVYHLNNLKTALESDPEYDLGSNGYS